MVDEATAMGTPRKTGETSVWTFGTDKISKVQNNVGVWRFELYLGTNLMFIEYFSVGTYLFDISVTGFSSDLATKVFIDGKEAGSIRSGEKKPSALPCGTHTMSVSAIVGSTSHIRYGCVQNSLNVQTEGSHTFEYSALASRLSVAVICLEFPDFPFKSTLYEIEKKTIDDLDSFYKSVSYGKLSIAGSVFGWYRMPSALASYGADLSAAVVQWKSSQDRMRMMNDGLTVARSNLVNTESYSYVILVFSGPYFGFADSVGGHVAALSERNDWDVFAHEFGHLLGLPDLYRTSEAQGGFRAVYAGYWDIMSWEPADSMCAWSRIQLGWINQSQILTIGPNSRNASAVISPIETGQGTLVEKVLTEQVSEYYLVEVRQTMTRAGKTMAGGVLITRIDETAKEGMVQVIDANLCSSSDSRYELFDAAFGLWENRNPIYLDSNGGFAVVLLQKIEQSYAIMVTTVRVGKEALDAYEAISLANSAMQKVPIQSMLGKLEQAKAKLREAVQEYENGEFEDSIRTADDARTLAERESASAPSNMLVSIGVVVSVVAVVLAIVYSKRRKK
jgi:hypothetical protein